MSSCDGWGAGGVVCLSVCLGVQERAGWLSVWGAVCSALFLCDSLQYQIKSQNISDGRDRRMDVELDKKSHVLPQYIYIQPSFFLVR